MTATLCCPLNKKRIPGCDAAEARFDNAAEKLNLDEGMRKVLEVACRA